MTDDLAQDLPDSTIIDTDIDGVKSGGGKPAIESAPEKPEVPRKPESARDSLEAEAKKLESSRAKSNDEDEKDDEDKQPVAKDEKAEAKAKESPVKADGTEQETKTPKPSEGRKIIEAPARFLPRAKELWQNVPHEVRAEWQRGEQERETEISQYREAKTFRDELTEYDTMAKQSGTTVKDALGNYVRMEKALREDPATGFRALLQNMQMHPTQAIGHIMRAANVTPQQLVEHMQREPHAYTSLAQPRQVQEQPQQRQPDPEVEALRQQVEAMRVEKVHNEVIGPFLNEYEGAREVWPAIEKILISGILDEIHGGGLSPRDKLERALAMASPEIMARQGSVKDNSVLDLDQENAPAAELRGGKSVKSSLGGVTETVEPERRMSMRDMLEEEARKIGRRA